MISRRLLGNGEQVVLHLRQHWRVLFWPVVGLFLLAAMVGTALALLPAAWAPWSYYAVAAVAALVLLFVLLPPALRWATTTYTFTTRRIITRRGVLSRTGHDLPLARINDVSYRRSLADRLFGSGTLVLQTAADDAVVLPGIGSVERVHVEMTELLFGSHELSEPPGYDEDDADRNY